MGEQSQCCEGGKHGDAHDHEEGQEKYALQTPSHACGHDFLAEMLSNYNCKMTNTNSIHTTLGTYIIYCKYKLSGNNLGLSVMSYGRIVTSAPQIHPQVLQSLSQQVD